MRKTCYGIVAVSLLTLSALALLRGAFRSVEDLAGAENLMIVQVSPLYAEVHPLLQKDGIMDYEVTVLKLLNGDVGKADKKTSISTTQKLSPGARYLLAGREAHRNGKPWALFDYDLGVVKLPDDFNLATLNGKDTKAQVAAILSARREELEKEIGALAKEKQQLDAVLPKAKDGP